MQSKVPVDQINLMRDLVSDAAGDATLSELQAELYEDRIRYSMAHSLSNDEFDYMSPTLVPKDVREDYVLRFIEWTFDDTVTRASINIDYYSVSLTVEFIGGEIETFSQRFQPEPREVDQCTPVDLVKRG